MRVLVANNSEIEDSRNKSHAKISEFTVLQMINPYQVLVSTAACPSALATGKSNWPNNGNKI